MSSLFRNSGAGAKAAPKPDPKATFKSSLAGRLPTADTGSTNMAGAAVRTKSPVKFSQPPGATPAKLGKKDEPSSPGQEDVQKVNAWQAEMDTLEQTQMQIQNDQMNLLHSQIHILMRELGDLQKHFVALTQKVDEDGADLLGKMEEMKTEIKDAAEEAHAAIRLELAEHGNNAEELKAAMEEAHGALSKAMEDGLNNMSEQTSRDLANHAEAHGATVAELEAKLSADLQGAMDSHAQALQDLNNEHHEKHALNSEALENGLNSVLENAHGKLQDELTQLRHGGAGSLKELSRILADVTEQVDKIDQAVETEHNLRMEVEKKLDSMCEDLRQEVAVSLEESHSALKLEMAEIGGNQDQIKEAMADASAALKDEWMAAHGQLKGELDAHRKENDAKHKGHADAMSAMNDEHLEKHASNAAALEEGIQNVLGGSHAQLQKDLKMLQSGGAGSLKELSKVVADVTKQVDNIDQAVQQEHDLRLAVEEKLDKMFGDQDKTISDLKKDMKVALNEAHAALKVEIAEHGKNAQEIQAAMEEANAALKDEVNLAHGSLKKELGSLSKENAAQHKSHQETMRSINDAHHEIHAQNAEKLESGLKDVLSGAHAKLQDELKLLKSGGAGSLKDLSKILADVTQQVDNIDKAVNTEHELRMAVEAKLDKMFNDTDASMEKVKKELQVALKESHSALKLELAEHGKDKEAIKAAMEDANSALKEEMALHKGNLENHGKAHGSKLSDLEKSLKKDLDKAINEQKGALRDLGDEHAAKHVEHAQNSKAIEQGLHNTLAGAHSKLQAELKELQSGHVTTIGGLRDVLADVTKQVDTLTEGLDKEHDLRMSVEARVDDMIQELRKENEAALREAHAALRLEMGMLSKDGNEMKAAMAEAHRALKAEHGAVAGDLSSKLDSHAKGHASTMAEMERQLRYDLQRGNADLDSRHKELKDMHAKHANGLTTLDQRLALLEQSSQDKHRDAFKELQAAHGKINELVGALQTHKSKVDLSHGSTEERVAYLERQLKEKTDSQNALQGQFRGEALTREKTLTSVEMRLSKMETYFTEITDRSAKELEGVSARYRELQSKFDQTRALSENNKNLVEQRLAYLDRAMLDTSDSHAQALSAFHNEHGKEIAHLLQAERIAREQQEKTFLDYIQDARQQKDALEATVQEQLRLERVAREVQSQQLRDAITHQHNFVGNAEYTDILLQERSSREAAERALERRLESFERAISMERNERAQDMQRIWDAFDGHTHEAMSPIIREIPQPPPRKIVPTSMMSPRAITQPTYIETVPAQSTLTERAIMMPEVGLTNISAATAAPTIATTAMPAANITRMTSLGALPTSQIQAGSVVLPTTR
mmetsp:Transcript_120154/g.218441  ORF Transcript_120154/g.218441 Transcript_120154/m.218441 type:complete len:1349 (+) Transcript_120154:68-4114(+)